MADEKFEGAANIGLVAQDQTDGAEIGEAASLGEEQAEVPAP